MQRLPIRTSINLAAFNNNIVRSVSTDTVAIGETRAVEATRTLKSWKQIPGPASLPVIGPILNFLPGGKLAGCKGIELSKSLYENYGPIVRLNSMFGQPNLIFLFDADASEHFIRGENTMPIRPGLASLDYYRRYHNKTYDPDRKIGLSTSEGENWKSLRNKMNPIVLDPKIVHCYDKQLREVADDMITRIKYVRDEKNMIKESFGMEMNLWALESTGVVGLGTRLNCFDPNLPEDSEGRKLIQNVHDFFDIVERVDLRPSPWKYFSTPNFRKAMKIYEEQERLVHHYTKDAMKNLKQSIKDNDNTFQNEKPIIEKLLRMDEEVARMMAVEMMDAGVDSTANTAVATFYLLAKNPEKQDKLRKEVLENETDRTYLRACIKEAMRAMGSFNGNLRLTTKEHNLMGYKIPKGFIVMIQNYTMSNLEQYFPKPEKFLPERWISKEADYQEHRVAHPFAYLPFGYGVRGCIGRRIAELELEILVSKFVKNFQVEWVGPPPNIKFSTLNYIIAPYHFIFNDIKSNSGNVVGTNPA